VIVFPQDGLYHLQVKDAYGCVVKKAINVALALPTDATFTALQVDSSSTWNFQPNDLGADQYFWDFGDGSTSTEQSPAHHYAALGNYVVTLSTSDLTGCPANTTQQNLPFLFSGVFEQGDFMGQVFPNPFKDKLQLDFKKPLLEPMSILLENELGQQMANQQYPVGATHGVLLTSNLPAGIYWLKISQKDQNWAFRVVKW
jgi:hypothetical protein